MIMKNKEKTQTNVYLNENNTLKLMTQEEIKYVDENMDKYKFGIKYDPEKLYFIEVTKL